MNICYFDNLKNHLKKQYFLKYSEFYSRDCPIKQHCSMASIKGSDPVKNNPDLIEKQKTYRAHLLKQFQTLISDLWGSARYIPQG